MNKKQWRLYEKQAQILAAMGHPIRVAIVDFLKDGERCVCDIAERVGAERSNVSRHLAVMTRAGVLSSRKEGLMVFYQLQTPCVCNFINCATRVLKVNHQMDASALETI